MKANATDEKYASLPLRGSSNQIAKDSFNIVQDTVFFNLGLRPTQTTFSVTNFISFKLDEFANISLPDTFKVTITFKVYFSKLVGSSVVQDSSALQTLYVEYNKFRNYQSKAVYTFIGGFQSKAKIFSVTSSSSSGTFASYKDVLMLENEIRVAREYLFDPNVNVVQSIAGVLGSLTDADSCSSAGEYMVSWGKVAVADEYDLEWTYIDSTAISNYYILNTTTIDPKKIFANNATRVSITNENYQIPILYDNGGILFFRVRPVRIKQSGQRIEAVWSSNYVSGMGTYGFAGHERGLNWQASTSYAEEGKRKSVVQYFDGILKSRQTVTKDNNTCFTVVAETMYDYQGRPVIQVMPAPTLSRLIGYTPHFNRAINGADYDKDIFDTDTTGGINNCNAVLPGMGTASGASLYYSSSNTLVNTGINKYIPNANLYPFTETRYAPDNTGRIAMQSGVGKEFQINQLDPNNHSHETRYFYGSADQEELDALFGTEVGNATHYSKNMVRDANGQYSVSYVDMHGRTIATALAGKPESNMDTLLSSNNKTIVKKLLDTTNNLVSGTSIISSKSLLVTRAGFHRLQYSLLPDSISIKACDNNTICYDCLYDLEVTISNDCSNPGNQPVVIIRTNVSIAGLMDTTCNANIAFPAIDTSINLTEGSYLITKKLTISQTGLKQYNDIFLRRNTCKTLQQFIDEQRILLLAQIQCYPTCQACTDSLGTWATYRDKYMLNNNVATADSANFREQALLAYQAQKDACDDLCNNTGLQNSIRQQMLTDMTAPYGQYAEVDSAYDINNIFYSATGIDGLRFKQLPSGAFYKDEFGRPDSIMNDALQKVPPTDPSVTANNFLDNFKDIWAETLLPLHPEYCHLLKYESYGTSHIWDERFAKIETFKQAVDSGFLNPSAFSGLPANANFNPPATIARDPFFTVLETSYAAAFKDSLLNFVKAYSPAVSAWSIATIMAHCDSADVTCINTYKDINAAFTIDTTCRGELDFAWRYFREMYLNKKAQVVNNIVFSNCTDPGVLGWHTLSFPRIDILTGAGGLPTDPGVGMDSLNNFIDDNCHAYVMQWMDEMKPCNLTFADSAQIIPRLIGVCVAGGNADHIYGSSTVKPGTSSNGDTSFIQVLKSVLGSRYDSTCNAYLITAPKPYDKQPPYGDVEIWDKPDSCQCSRITSLYQQYQSSADTTFSNYVFRVTGTRIYPGVLDTLRMLCNGQIACKFLETPMVLPPALQCNVANTCVDCAQVNNVFTQFRKDFPGIIPTKNDLDSVQQNRNSLFEKYMNHQLGFSKSAVEYLEFLDTCSLGYGSNTTSCDSLSQLLNYYQQNIFNQDIPKYDVGGCDTSMIKINTGDSLHHSVTARLADWMSNGVLKGPWNDSTISTSSPNFFFEDTICTNNYFSFQTRIRNPYSAQAEAKYISLGRPMYFSSFYGTFQNSVHFDNGSKVVSIGFARGKGYPGILTDSIFMTIQSAENGSYSSEVIKSTGLKHFGDWATLKIQTDNNSVYIVLNGNILDTVTFSTNIEKFNRYGLVTYSFDVQTDWWKIYDNNGQLRYFEDFNGCDKLAKQTMPSCTPDCKQQFVTYFNTQRGTNYSFSQIDSLYFNVCGTHPDPCYVNPLDCNHLNEAIKDYYISKNNITYDSIGVEHGVWAYEQNTKNCNFSQVQLKNRFASGIFDGHPFADSCGKDYQINYKLPICLGNQFTLISRMQVFDTMPYISRVPTLTDINFWFDNSKNVTVRFKHPFPGTGYAFDIITESGTTAFTFVDANAGSFNNFQTWKNVKVTFKNDSVIVCLDDGTTFIEIARTYYPGNFTKISKFGFAGTQYGVQMDWVKIYDAANNLQYFEDFVDNTNFIKVPKAFICPPINCSSDFTSYFNNRFNKSYTYNQVLDLYKSQCNISFEPCGPSTAPKLCGSVDGVFPPTYPPDLTPCGDSTLFSVGVGTKLYNAYQDSLVNSFNNRYLAKCLKARYNESFTVTAPISEFHYTLYYYDQAGNLVKTVPPSGVDVSKFSWAVAYSDSVKISRAANQVKIPSHVLATHYRYNTLNQVVAQYSPDGGASKFWYDRLGRLVISQNAKQKANSGTELNALYSYTKYDYLGRIAEVGQIKNTSASAPVTNLLTRNNTSLISWLTTRNTVRGQITNTQYDTKYTGFIGSEGSTIWQRNVRNRVSYTSYTDTATLTGYNNATFYSYDIHGNVDTLLQDYGNSTLTGVTNVMNVQTTNANRWKRLVYRYDLISGKVNHVAYQPPRGTTYYPDMFYHRYSYDAENRLTLAETSMDSVVWEKEARYDYYRHGPLARTTLGEQLVQGTDYAYTLQGWVKGVNAISLTNADFDIGNDGKIGVANQYVARDAMGFNLNYFAGDYLSINTTVSPFPGASAYLAGSENRPLYNGNINSMAVNIKFPSPTAAQGPQLNNYKYDQLNRITGMDVYRGLNQTTNTWSAMAQTTDYKERVAYDANGNILQYLRNGNITATPVMDSLSYKYTAGTNQLNWVKDNVAAATYTDDIDNNQAASNYLYDAIGNLVRDSAEGIRLSAGGIKWNVYGKITEINKVDSSVTVMNKGRIKKITYTYDAAGNRISKKVENYLNTNKDYTWYVRDASGNVMAIYNSTGTSSTISSAGYTLNLAEQHLYGSSRIGILNRNVSAKTAFTKPSIINFVRGNKFFELVNHLQNSLVTISDKKIGHNAGNGTIDYYDADIITASDYYPGGMTMPGRKYSSTNKYRYGFNGKENDNEVKGEGNQQDYGLRIYDPRLVRFLSIDPLADAYPWYTPYQFAGNSPIANIDLDGGEPKPAINGTEEGQEQTTYQNKQRWQGGKNGRWVNDGQTSKDWYWHAGGLGTGRSKKNADGTSSEILTQAGWYTSEGYFNTLKSTGVAGALANELHLPNAAAQPYSNSAELSKFVGDGLNINAEKHLIAAARSKANDANFAVTGTTYASGFNVEDMLGIGLLFKEGVKILGSIVLKNSIRVIASEELLAALPMQLHHFATNKSTKWTSQMSSIASKFGLDLDGAWNKELLPHLGRHPDAYHQFVFNGMQRAATEAGTNQAIFIQLFERYVKSPVRGNPQLLRKAGWQ